MVQNTLRGPWLFFFASVVLFLGACDVKEKAVTPPPPGASTRSVIPKELWGNYQASQPSYDMCDLEGHVLRINGRTVRVPSTRSLFSISGNRISWQQEAVERDSREVVKYEPGIPKIAQQSGERVLVECDFATPDGRSKPSLRFQCDLRTGRIVLLGDRGSADCELNRQ